MHMQMPCHLQEDDDDDEWLKELDSELALDSLESATQPAPGPEIKNTYGKYLWTYFSCFETWLFFSVFCLVTKMFAFDVDTNTDAEDNESAPDPKNADESSAISSTTDNNASVSDMVENDSSVHDAVENGASVPDAVKPDEVATSNALPGDTAAKFKSMLSTTSEIASQLVTHKCCTLRSSLWSFGRVL